MKFNKLFLLGFVLSYIPMHVTASVRINEVMPCNFSTYMDRDYFNFSGYVEFYNDSEDTISLRDYTLSHYKLKKSGKYSKKWIWTVDKDVVIPAHSYQIVWMDEMTMVNHCPYKLDADGGYVTLSIDSQLIDSISYQKMLPRIAYGRYEAQEGYMLPSPEKENTVAYGVLNDSTRAAQPSADVTSGIKTEPFYLTLSSESEHADIYYTLNGTEPSIANGLTYSTPIYVAENMNLRVIAYEEGKLTLRTRVFVPGRSLNKVCFTPKQNNSYLLTTVGKLIFNKIFPDDFPFINFPYRNDKNAKKEHYERVREFAAHFRESEGSIICKELLARGKTGRKSEADRNADNADGNKIPEKVEIGGEPEERTADYYKKRPCPDLVYRAAEILDDMLSDKK